MRHPTTRSQVRLRDLVRRFLPYLRPVRPRVAIAVALVLASPLVGAGLLWFMKRLVDEVLVAARLDRLPWFAAVYLLVAASRIVLDYATTRFEAAIVERIVQDVRTSLYRHLISISPGSLSHGVGDLLARLTEDIDRVEILIFTGPLRLFADLAGALFFGCFLFVLSWKLALFALLAVPLLAVAGLRYSPRVRRTARVARRAASAWLARAEERLGAAPVVHAFGMHADEAAQFAARCDAARRAELGTVAVQAWLTLLVEAAATLGGLLVLGAGAYEIGAGRLSVGGLVAFLGAVGALYEPVRGLARTSGRFQRAAAGGGRVAELLDAPSLVVERPAARPLPPVRGAIELRDVRFGYPQGPEVVKGISLRIEPGEMVALVGPSGSGKSTLARLLLRLYDPAAGAILLDGADIRDVSLDSLRRSVSVVFQEPFIFRGSVADNIRYGRAEAADRDVTAMARAAHAHSFVTALRGGYHAAVGPRGAWLSGGQRQRLALARALLRDAPILVLDEATAAVDSETEELIHEAVERLAGHRTILVIGHRLSSLRRADRVVVLDQGRIVESGAPDALLRAGTRYRDLFAAQLELGKSA